MRVSLAILTFLVLTFAVSGCKKNRPDDPDKPDKEVKTPVDVAPSTGNRTELTKDSIFFYARQVYLWWNHVPDYQTFKPRTYPSFSRELYALTRYGIDPLTKKPYEFSAKANGEDAMEPKFSYLTNTGSSTPIAYIPSRRASVDLQGHGQDFGFRPTLVWINQAQKRFGVLITAVNQNSPAEQAGLQRGDLVTHINGQEIGTYSETSVNMVNNAIFSASGIRVKGIKRGKTAADPLFDVWLDATFYTSSPIYKQAVYTAGAKKIGYLAYARFSDLISNSQSELDKAFTNFASQGVTDLIIDLRYNGGGYVNTAEYLSNLVAPPSADKKVMFAEHYNQLMQQGKATILGKQRLYENYTYLDMDFSVKSNTYYFSKKGTLNQVSTVVFIVSEHTASASELVINNLKPYMKVKVVGSTTFGKPVGFFPIKIDNYDVYYSMFEAKNAKGEGGYFAGMKPDTGDSANDDDDPYHDFGDLKEASFLAAYNYITKGTFTSAITQAKTLANKASVLNATENIEDKDFKGMIQHPESMRRR